MPAVIDLHAITLDAVAIATERTGDAHGNAPKFHPAQQWTLEVSAKAARSAMRDLGMSYCRTCAGWHK